jgi:hypothetical protein
MANRIPGTVSTASSKEKAPSWHEREKESRKCRIQNLAARVSALKSNLPKVRSPK